jgi:hypothetical protein
MHLKSKEIFKTIFVKHLKNMLGCKLVERRGGIHSILTDDTPRIG